MDLVSRKNRVFSLAVLGESVCRSGGLISGADLIMAAPIRPILFFQVESSVHKIGDVEL